jgi:hypothetical protein
MRDASTGLPTGKRMHKPMVIKKDAPLQPTLLESGGPSGGNAPAAMGAPLNSPATGRGTIR